MKYLKTFEGWNPFKNNNKKVDHGSGYGSDIDSNSVKIRLSSLATKSFENDLKKNKISYTKERPTVFIVENTPKARMAIQMVKERFGRQNVIVESLSINKSRVESDYDLEITEGKLMKSKSVDSDVKKEQFREKINNYIKSQDCKTKQVGDDFEIHYDDDHIAQVMFREDYIGIKKESNKFPKEFGYDEFGKIKKELSSIIKSCK